MRQLIITEYQNQNKIKTYNKKNARNFRLPLMHTQNTALIITLYPIHKTKNTYSKQIHINIFTI